jgi:hypothetical protein
LSTFVQSSAVKIGFLKYSALHSSKLCSLHRYRFWYANYAFFSSLSCDGLITQWWTLWDPHGYIESEAKICKKVSKHKLFYSIFSLADHLAIKSRNANYSIFSLAHRMPIKSCNANYYIFSLADRMLIKSLNANYSIFSLADRMSIKSRPLARCWGHFISKKK